MKTITNEKRIMEIEENLKSALYWLNCKAFNKEGIKMQDINDLKIAEVTKEGNVYTIKTMIKIRICDIIVGSFDMRAENIFCFSKTMSMIDRPKSNRIGCFPKNIQMIFSKYGITDDVNVDFKNEKIENILRVVA